MRPILTQKIVRSVIAQWTGIPVERIGASEINDENLNQLEEKLNSVIFGQEEAISKVVKALKRRFAFKEDGLYSRPIANILCVGASGVGKTELAKQLAEQFFGDNRKLIKINMNDFREPHTASRLVGAPPGYVGYNRGGELTEALRKNPFSVVLFDEVEKAHPEVVTNILLQLMDEGVLSDMSTGALVDGSNALIMMTSNLGNRETLQREMGFAAKTKESLNEKQYKERILSAVRSFFPPEFLGRLDEIVLFNRLTPDVRKRILEKAVRQLEDKLKKTLKASVTIKLSDRALSLLLEEASEDKEAGARAVLRVVKLRIEEPCAEMFGGQLEEGVAQSIRVDVDNFGKVVLTLETI